MNTSRNAQQTRESSANALKTVYYLIVGLAVIKAIPETFLHENVFLGLKIFSGDHLVTTLLFLIFFSTIVRFVHGASIHLDIIQEKGIKPLLDFIMFFIQGSLFFLMATSLKKPYSFCVLLFWMLISDTLWLIVLGCIKYLKWESTEKQWFASNITLLIFGTAICRLFDPDLSSTSVIFIYAVLAVAAFFWDYAANKPFYFPEIKRQGN